MEVAPFLLGYVMTRPKPTSEVILATESGEPLLAWWRYGLGMTTAFTSDAKSRWAAEWITWEGYSKFWTQVVRQTMRKSYHSNSRSLLWRRNQFVKRNSWAQRTKCLSLKHQMAVPKTSHACPFCIKLGCIRLLCALQNSLILDLYLAYTWLYHDISLRRMRYQRCDTI